MAELPGTGMRVVRPDPQAVMPWAEGSAEQLLALPVADVLRWRMRMDLKRPRIVGFDNDWVEDPRYQDLMESVRSGTCWPAPLIFFGIGLVAYELICNDAAMGLARMGIRFPDVVMRRWCFQEEDRAALNAAIGRGLKVGMLTLVEAADPAAVGAYACVRRAPRGERRHDTTSTGQDTTKDGDGEGTGEGRDDERKASARTGNDDDGRRRAPTTTGGDRRGTGVALTLPGSEIVIAPRDPVNVITGIRTWLAPLRKRNRLPAWPGEANTKDLMDLQRAVFLAIEGDRLPALLEVLYTTAEWAADGRGFRDQLRKRGFIT